MWAFLSKYCIIIEVNSLLGEVAQGPYPPCQRGHELYEFIDSEILSESV